MTKYKNTPGPHKLVVDAISGQRYIVGRSDQKRPTYIATIEPANAASRHGYEPPREEAVGNSIILQAAFSQQEALREIRALCYGTPHEKAADALLNVLKIAEAVL
jgi:hypothetical protein